MGNFYQKHDQIEDQVLNGLLLTSVAKKSQSLDKLQYYFFCSPKDVHVLKVQIIPNLF